MPLYPNAAIPNRTNTWTASQTFPYAQTGSAPATFGSNALFRITQTRNGQRQGDAMFAVYDTTLSAQQTLQFLILDNGGLYSGRELVLSQRHATNGSIVDLAAGESGTLTASPDGNFTAIKVDCGLAQYGANSYAMAIFDADDIDPAYPSASGNFGSGYKKWTIGQTGTMLWGTALSTTPASNYDISLGRTSSGVLTFQTRAADAQLVVKAPSGQTPYLQLYRDSVKSFEISGTGDTTAQFKSGSIQIMNFYSGASLGRVAIGGDRSGSELSIVTANGLPGITVVQTSGGSPQDMLQFKPSADNAIYSRFNKAGYFMTAKTSAPADADVSTSECALWFDNTNGAGKLMIKAKTANGTVVTGSVTLT